MKNIRFKVVVTNQTWDNVQQYIDYYKPINTNYSSKILNNFLELLGTIEEYPFMFSKLEGMDKYRYVVILKRFIIIYFIKAKEIKVVNFVDGKTNYQELL